MRPLKDPAPAAPYRPSQDWIDAFDAQCTKELYQDARRCAAHRARSVRRAGGVADDYYERELVQDALTDTTLGILH
jgi:hypothetical protein